ncbi:hypothetical protein [Spirosoma rhododendri]|uniref:Uncharacterized protein n=1 Tax=Spirosoma rhododendri TaxID=2728024 RepID=A0A7L5DNP1_9BACT|nr:hypothetical protein [Spirosoma rhododendri]QJD77370.1 hypothetical protein HH216_02250 [Spirosoma rhododendri]
MNPNDNTSYNPADDDNQGVAQLMAQGADAEPGVSQVERMNPVVDSTVTNSGPEPVKEEVNDDAEEDGDSSINTDELTEEDVETNSLTVNGVL